MTAVPTCGFVLMKFSGKDRYTAARILLARITAVSCTALVNVLSVVASAHIVSIGQIGVEQGRCPHVCALPSERHR